MADSNGHSVALSGVSVSTGAVASDGHFAATQLQSSLTLRAALQNAQDVDGWLRKYPPEIVLMILERSGIDIDRSRVFLIGDD